MSVHPHCSADPLGMLLVLEQHAERALHHDLGVCPPEPREVIRDVY
jgi:hypothetical protein